MTYFIEDLLTRKSICETCEFRSKRSCTKADNLINSQIYYECPAKKWPKIKKKPPTKTPRKNHPQRKLIKVSIFTMVFSATKSFVLWALSGFQKPMEKVIQERLKICQSCEFWDKEALNSTGRCNICGCSTWAKLRMATEKCPINKWGSVPTTRRNNNAKTRRTKRVASDGASRTSTRDRKSTGSGVRP